MYNTYLIISERGEPVSVTAISRRWAKECAAASIEGLQFRDPRAMAEMDKAESAGDFGEAQRQLGHTTVAMTEHYTRQRRGQKTPLTG